MVTAITITHLKEEVSHFVISLIYNHFVNVIRIGVLFLVEK